MALDHLSVEARLARIESRIVQLMKYFGVDPYAESEVGAFWDHMDDWDQYDTPTVARTRPDIMDRLQGGAHEQA